MPQTIDEYAYDVLKGAVTQYGLMRTLDKLALVCREQEEDATAKGYGSQVAASWRRMKTRLEWLANREDGPLY